eukprot:TRINITY_DN2267_c0_g1_i5.p4 TRINITY_DN2267_c0_g1~~TRINITY_DN2267_c0_g1_i5.p4  ORF type:complete len:101 (+),score=1.69 TRINITY_DN2267_c0_g1_i5:490-792(+)
MRVLVYHRLKIKFALTKGEISEVIEGSVKKKIIIVEQQFFCKMLLAPAFLVEIYVTLELAIQKLQQYQQQQFVLRNFVTQSLQQMAGLLIQYLYCSIIEY